MPKVYIIHKSDHDFSNAIQYGELVYLSKELVDRFNTTEMLRLINNGFHGSICNDYIVINGMAIMVSIAIAVFAFKHGRVNLLLWKSDTQEYVKRSILL